MDVRSRYSMHKFGKHALKYVGILKYYIYVDAYASNCLLINVLKIRCKGPQFLQFLENFEFFALKEDFGLVRKQAMFHFKIED